MRSFVEMNGASLTDFFNEALQARRVSGAGPDGLSKWANDSQAHNVLIQSHSPVLTQANEVLYGIHARAFMYDDHVVKTNLFGGFHYDGGRIWLEWSARQQSNPLVPKIAMLLVDQETDRFLVVMERLTCHSGFEFHEHRGEIDTALKQSFLHKRGRKSLHRTLKDVRKESEAALVELNADLELVRELEDEDCEAQLLDSIHNHEITLRYVKELTALWDHLTHTGRSFFDDIRKHFDDAINRGHLIDVHCCNWMLRDDGQQVLLDPVN